MLTLSSVKVDMDIDTANFAGGSLSEGAVWQVAESLHVEKAIAPPTIAQVRRSSTLKKILLLGRGRIRLPGPCNVVCKLTVIHYLLHVMFLD